MLLVLPRSPVKAKTACNHPFGTRPIQPRRKYRPTTAPTGHTRTVQEPPPPPPPPKKKNTVLMDGCTFPASGLPTITGHYLRRGCSWIVSPEPHAIQSCVLLVFRCCDTHKRTNRACIAASPADPTLETKKTSAFIGLARSSSSLNAVLAIPSPRTTFQTQSPDVAENMHSLTMPAGKGGLGKGRATKGAKKGQKHTTPGIR